MSRTIRTIVLVADEICEGLYLLVPAINGTSPLMNERCAVVGDEDNLVLHAVVLIVVVNIVRRNRPTELVREFLLIHCDECRSEKVSCNFRRWFNYSFRWFSRL